MILLVLECIFGAALEFVGEVEACQSRRRIPICIDLERRETATGRECSTFPSRTTQLPDSLEKARPGFIKASFLENP